MFNQPTLPTTGALLAIDYGKKRIGLAYCDDSQTFVFGLPTLEQPTGKDKLTLSLQALCTLITTKNIVGIVLGLPRNMDGSAGFMAETIEAFAAQLREAVPAIPIFLLDERLTSKIAEQQLRSQGITPSRNKGMIDQQAAKQLLEDYLRAKQLQQ
jgi:putative Holliday junction resolvase